MSGEDVDITAVVGDGQFAGLPVITDSADACFAETIGLAEPIDAVIRPVYGKKAVRSGAIYFLIRGGYCDGLVIGQMVPPLADGGRLRQAGKSGQEGEEYIKKSFYHCLSGSKLTYCAGKPGKIPDLRTVLFVQWTSGPLLTLTGVWSTLKN